MGKRSAGAIAVLGAAIVAGLVLLLDPDGWFEDEAVSGTEPLSTTAPGTPSLAPAPPLESLPDEADVSAPGEVDRRALDPVADAGRVALRVLEPDGVPVSGARVLLLREAAIHFDDETDEAGEVELAADGKMVGFFVAVAARPPEWREVRLDPGRQDVRLTDGESLAGRIEREDGERIGILELELASDHPLPTSVGIPPVVWNTLDVWTRDRAHLHCDTDADGTFAFAGLPPSWSGLLQLPFGRQVVETSDGEVVSSLRGSIRLEYPATGLVVRLSARPSLHGRLVLRDDGSPLEGAIVFAMVDIPGASSPIAVARTEEDGRFDLGRDPGRADRLDLRVGWIHLDPPWLLSLRNEDIAPDGDLGDVVVDGVRNVPFVLQDPQGTPIAGGTAMAEGVDSAPTDDDGRSEIKWLAREVVSMAVTAVGFLPRVVELPEVIAAPLVVVLEPTNRLEVRLVPPAGGNPRQFKIHLRREEGLTATGILGFDAQFSHVGEPAFPPLAVLREPPGTYLTSRPRESDGIASFFALRSGVEIELLVIGVGGDAEFHRETLAPLGPSEVRRHEVDLEGKLLVFRGRVLDEDGNPLVQARLHHGLQILGTTDEEGAFLCFPQGKEPENLWIRHDACAPLLLPDYRIPADGKPVEFRLAHGNRVTIEVVDEAGRPVPFADIWLSQADVSVYTGRLEPHRHVATTLADGPFELTVSLAGWHHKEQHDTSTPEVRVVVPVHGRVTATVSDAVTAGRNGRFVLKLHPTGDGPGGPVDGGGSASPELRLEVPAVLPGTYEARLYYRPSREERDAGGEILRWRPTPLTVKADEETMISFDLPADD